MTQPYQDNQAEPFFITPEVEAELAAAGYEFAPPSHIRTKNISELYGWQQGETLFESVNRYLGKCGVVSECGLEGSGV